MARLAEIQEKRILRILESTTRSETHRETSRQVSRHGIRGVPSMFRVKIDMTWSATQVGLRPVESGLGGHEEGVRGVDDGVKNASLPLRKRVRTTMSECATFSDFRGVDNEILSESRNGNDTPIEFEHLVRVVKATTAPTTIVCVLDDVHGIDCC